MNRTILVFLISNTILFAQIGRKKYSPEENILQTVGLENQVVTALVAEVQEPPRVTAFSKYLFAATQKQGVFIGSIDDSLQSWRPLGLAGKFVTAMTVQHWGIGPLDGLKLWAAVLPNFQQGDSTLLYSSNFFLNLDTTWVVADSGINKKVLTRIWAIASYYFSGHEPPQPSLLGGETGLYHASYQGLWKEAQVDSPAAVNALYVHPHWFGHLAWAVGHTGASPAAFKSLDQGKTWKTILLPDFVRGQAWSVAMNPRYPDTVYVGLDGEVIMTPNGGESWQKSGLENSLVIFTAVAVNPNAPEQVFVGGVGERNSFAFYSTNDGGISWNPIYPPEGQHIAGISSIVVLYANPTDQNPLVFIATYGSGVWLYKPEITIGVQNRFPLPQKFILHENYPNPFNPETTIEYELAEPGHVRLAIYNLLGQRIRTLVDEWQQAGSYQVSWDGTAKHGAKRAASGIYVYELKVNDTIIRKKMVLL